MSIGSLSFWQMNQNYWARAQRVSVHQTLNNAVITQMFNATTNLSTGLSSIANRTALDRVQSQLSSAVQSALQQIAGGSAPSSSTASGSSTTSALSATSLGATAAGTSAPAPATGIGTAALTSATPLSTLGILAKGTITVSDGINTTTYNTTGSDTVNDLINAINTSGPKNAAVTASLNASGRLVLTADNNTATILIGGLYASNIGFGVGHTSFQPIVPPAPASASTGSAMSGGLADTPATATAASSAAQSSSKATATNSSAGLLNSATALQSGGSAELLLASSGLAGSLLNLLA